MIKNARLDDESEKNEEVIRKEASLEKEEEKDFNFIPNKNGKKVKIGVTINSPFLK